VLRLYVCSDPHLQFVEEVALPPPEVAIDLAEQERNERELAEAVNAPLPADDDDELID
jgi:GTP-binding nuclear protein Ran